MFTLKRLASTALLLLMTTLSTPANAIHWSQPADYSSPQVMVSYRPLKPIPAYLRRWNETILWNNTALWNSTVLWNNTAAWNKAANAGGGPPYVAVASTGNLGGVVQCIKDHESGNYSESTHTGSGSGAYQFIPRTWRYYFGRWKGSLTPTKRARIPYYDLAFLAPPSVQDAVLNYALTHGGAGNWSNRFGNDPCTQGL